MQLRVKIISVITSIIMIISLSSCTNTDWVFKIPNSSDTISSGVYLSYLINSYSEAYQIISDNLSNEGKTISDPKEVFNHEIEGSKAKDWIINKSTELSKQHLAVNKHFSDLGLSFEEADHTSINSTLENFWKSYGEYFQLNGVSKDSMKLSIENTLKREKIFNKYFNKDGIQEVSDDELKSYFIENYAKIKYISMPIINPDESAVTDEQKEQFKQRADAYAQRIKNGENIDNLIKEYETILEKQKENPESGFELSPDEKIEVSEDEAKSNFNIIPKNDERYPENIVKEVFASGFNTPIVVEEQSSYYIVVRYDIKEDQDNFNSYRDTVLAEIKKDPFDSIIKSETEKLNIEENKTSIKRYSPENIKNEK